MDTDYRRYEELKANGSSADAACADALRDRDFTYCIRMLRSVYGLSLIGARDVLLRLPR